MKRVTGMTLKCNAGTSAIVGNTNDDARILTAANLDNGVCSSFM